MSISRFWGATALLALLVCVGALPAAAADPSTGSLRIVPAVRYAQAEQDAGLLAPRNRSILAWYQDEALPGGLTVLYTPETRESFPTVLLDGGNHVLSRGTSFRWGKGWISLVAVPPTVRPGAYELWLPDIRVPFRVTARRFASETIPLTSDLTALRTQSDPRKTAEAVELADLLAAADPSAMYETGAFSMPLTKPRRTAGYGDRREYLYDNGSADFSVHAGVDLALREGTPVAACGRGRVVMAKERVVTGWTVVIEHLPGLYSLYFHMSGVAVRVGDVVEQGQCVGLLGMTGLATGPHLHWEVQAGGVAVDPDPLTAGLPFVPGRWPIPERSAAESVPVAPAPATMAPAMTAPAAPTPAVD